MGNWARKGIHGLLPGGWHLLPTVTARLSPYWFGEKVTATKDDSPKEARTRQHEVKTEGPANGQMREEGKPATIAGQ